MAQPPSQAPNTAPGAAGMPAQPLTAEQVRQMQIMSKQAMGLLLEDQTAEMIVQQAKQGNPSEVVATIVNGVMQQLYQAATEAGQQVEMVTIMVTGIQIIGTLAEMLSAAGVLPEQGLEQFIGQTAKIAVDKHNAALQQGGQGAPA